MRYSLSDRIDIVVIVVVLHGVLKSVDGCEDVRKRSEGEYVSKTLSQCMTVHEGNAWAQPAGDITVPDSKPVGNGTGNIFQKNVVKSEVVHVD